MDNKAIETLSVNAVRNSLVVNDVLHPYINDNDKEPSWDGNIIIYRNAEKVKSNIKGRVSTQIKGKECNDFSRETISYPISLVDLRNYLYDGGVIFFVVYVTSSIQTKIYYAPLLPVKLKMLLTNAKDQKTTSIELKAFPEKNDQKTNIFLNFYENKIKQASFIYKDIISIEDLQKNYTVESLSFSYCSVGIKSHADLIQAVLSDEVYLYANIKGSSIPQPLDAIPLKMIAGEHVRMVVSANGINFYSGYELIREKDMTITKIGKSFTITITANNSNNAVIKFKLQGSLTKRIVDLDFMLNTIEGKGFSIDQSFIPLEFIESDINKLGKQKEHLEHLKKIKQVMDLLSVQKDLEISQITDQQDHYLSQLITAFIDKKPVSGLDPDLPPVVNIDIGNIKLALIFIHCDEEDRTKYNIYDFFKTKFPVCIMDAEQTVQDESCQFIILRETDFLTVDNIDYHAIYSAIKDIKPSDVYYDQLNLLMLRMLNAYDKMIEKPPAMFDAIISTANLLLENAENLPITIRKLNYFQVIKRDRDFNKEEMQELLQRSTDSLNDYDFLTAVNLLLDNQKAAEFYFDQMTHEMQESFKQYPIFHYWKCTTKQE